MKSYILIDGENFVHRIERVLQDANLIRSRQSLKKLALADLLATLDQKPESCCYYTTKIRVPQSRSDLHAKVERMRKWNAQWIPYIANQRVTIVKAGLLRVRTSKICAHCGHRTSILQEKGVDVRLAVDIVTHAGKNATIYVVSSDTDLIPAMVSAKAAGARVIYVAVEGAEIGALAKTAGQVSLLTKKDIIKAYKKANV